MIVLLIVVGALTFYLAPFFLFTGIIGIKALRSRRDFDLPQCDDHHLQFTILIPAHDEQSVISATISSVLRLNYPSTMFECIVIADNCTDQTAQIATTLGVTVWRREHQTLRGKGYALEYAVNRILTEGRATKTDAIVIIDADTQVDPNMLAVFARHINHGHHWIQGYYNASNSDASWRTMLLTYALALINGVWLSGQNALGVGAGLRGNGMCFSISGLRRMPWQASGLAEDLEFSWKLRLRNEFVYFAPTAKVFGELVSQHSPGAVSQRQRWEHGRNAVKHLFFRRILRAQNLTLGRKLWHLLDLYMLPLSKMASYLLAVMLLTALGNYHTVDHALFCGLIVIQTILALCLGFYALIPIMTNILPGRYLFSIAYLPKYVMWKFVLWFQKAPKAWVKTHREMSK